MDLQNEPAQATWGSGNPNNDWALGAAEIGNHVLSRCPRWLIMVEGVADNPGAAGEQNAGTFWGENLKGATKHPVCRRVQPITRGLKAVGASMVGSCGPHPP